MLAACYLADTSSGPASIISSKQITSRYAASKHVPKPDLAVRVTGAMLITGGASILLGIPTKAWGDGDHRIPGRRFANDA